MSFNKKSYKICIVLLFIIVFNLIITTTTVKESFDNNSKLILMGDSVFNNTNYVNKGHSIRDIMSKKYNNLTIVAQDNAVINDLKKQYQLIPDSKKESNSKIIVSIGGNDLLNHYKINDVSNTKYVDTIFNKYVSNIEYITDNFKGEVIICNIYYPQDKLYKKFHPIIDKWNKKITNFSNSHNLKVVKLDEFVNKNQHFVKGIEPSYQGGLAIKQSMKYI